MNRRPHALLALLPAGSVALALACGTTPEPNAPEGIPLAAPPPNRGGAAATEQAPAAGAASALAAASVPAAKAPPSPGGAPMPVMEGDTEVATAVGYRGGKIRLTGSGAELSLPAGALSDGLAFSFAVAPAKGSQAAAAPRGALGTPHKLAIRRVEGGETIGSAVAGATTPITSGGPPFVIKLTLPPNAKGASLAVGSGPDLKKPAYKIYPSASIESGEPAKAVFQLPSLPGESVLQLTSAEPTEKP